MEHVETGADFFKQSNVWNRIFWGSYNHPKQIWVVSTTVEYCTVPAHEVAEAWFLTVCKEFKKYPPPPASCSVGTVDGFLTKVVKYKGIQPSGRFPIAYFGWNIYDPKW